MKITCAYQILGLILYTLVFTSNVPLPILFQAFLSAIIFGQHHAPFGRMIAAAGTKQQSSARVTAVLHGPLKIESLYGILRLILQSLALILLAWHFMHPPYDNFRTAPFAIRLHVERAPRAGGYYLGRVSRICRQGGRPASVCRAPAMLKAVGCHSSSMYSMVTPYAFLAACYTRCAFLAEVKLKNWTPPWMAKKNSGHCADIIGRFVNLKHYHLKNQSK